MNKRIKKKKYKKSEQQLIRDNHQLVLDYISNHAKGITLDESVVFDLTLITGVIPEYTPITYKHKCIGYVKTDTQTDKPIISTNLFAHNLETMMLNDRIASLEIKITEE